MQRLLSLVTLIVLLGLGWFFASNFKIEGLQNVEVKPRSASYQDSNPNSAHPLSGSPPPIARQGNSIQIASFYIENFAETKASQGHVMQVLANIFRGFDILAIQGIRSAKGETLLRDFLDQINERYQRHYRYVIGPRLGERHQEQYAFVYDAASVEADLAGSYTISDPFDVLLREPLVVPFRVRGPPSDQAFTFILINIHLDPDAVVKEMNILADVYHAVRQASPSEDDVMILGNLNADDRHLGRLGEISGIHPVIQHLATNTTQTHTYDHLILHLPSTAEFTGHAGVLDVMRQFNLTTQQVLAVSDHLPIWAEFRLHESMGPGNQIATQPRNRWDW